LTAIGMRGFGGRLCLPIEDNHIVTLLAQMQSGH
jgi:hypothetical protein